MVRHDAKRIIKDWLTRSTIAPMTKSLLNLGITQVPDDSPLLTVTGDVLNAIERKDYEDARRILYKTADTLIEHIQHDSEHQGQ